MDDFGRATIQTDNTLGTAPRFGGSAGGQIGILSNMIEFGIDGGDGNYDEQSLQSIRYNL